MRVRRAAFLGVPLACVVLALSWVTGCSSQQGVTPDRILHDPHAAGDNQCGMYGEALARPLRVLVEGAHEKGVLGGKGGRRTVPGVDVTFAIEHPDSGAVFTENGATALTVSTDVAGTASARLRLGSRPGDTTVLASVRTPHGVTSVRFRATAGVRRLQPVLEGPTGGRLDEVGLVLYEAQGQPAEGVPVYFRVENNRHGSAVKPERVVTDSQGRATTSWKLGQDTQQYFLVAEIQDERADKLAIERFQGRGVVLEAMAVNTTRLVVTLFGGLAVFIFGMKLMSGGLQRMADRRLKAILSAMTRNRWLAVGVGALLTAMIQSSSATTVMVVGFVNAGLLTLTQAVGVVFGANIGTTVTAQIIAFKLNVLAFPAIALGLIFASLGRTQFLKALGESILGFGLLFLGMTIMSDVLKPLRYSPEFQSWFQMFDCAPFDGAVPWGAAFMCILIGTATTVVVQSSSATVGLVIALAGQGLLGFHTAVPLILGDNIGTTITAQLAALGANRNAKRAAMAHTMFNVAGAAYMYALLFVPLWRGQPLFLGFVNAITPGDVFAAVPQNLPRHIANAHTAFNVVNCALFVPLIGLMVRACLRIIPVKTTAQETVMEYLDPHLLLTPAIALDRAVSEVDYMVRRSQEAFELGCAYFHGGSDDLEAKVRQGEKRIDRLQQEITDYLVGLSRQELEQDEAALIPLLVHAVNDAERIGDHAEDLVELAHQRQEHEIAFTAAAEKDLRDLEDLLREQFKAAHLALGEKERGQKKQTKRTEAAITELVDHITESHMRRLETGECETLTGIVYLDYVANLERMADHLLNIGKRSKKIVRVTR